MNDLNWKTWGLIFLVALGITFEGLKRLPGGSASKWSAENLKFTSAQTTPYQVQYKRANVGQPPAMLPLNHAKPDPAHAAGLAAVNRETIEKFIAANKTHTSDFNHTPGLDAGKDGKAKAKAKSKKLGPDEEWEVVVDPKTGKRYKRRKKKVAKVEEVKTVVAKTEPKKEEPKKEEDEIQNMMNEAIAGNALSGGGSGQPDSPHADLEEWKRRLLARPDAAETRRFIEHYKNGIVSAEIFYKIIALMMEDSRPQMKELGLLCAGMTPSVLSFQVLAGVLKEERSGTSLRAYAESFLKQYSSLGNTVITRILKSPSSSFIAIQAMKRLEDSANNYLDPKKNKTPKNPSPASAGKHSNAGYFTQYISPLNALVRNSDVQVKEQARMTLGTLNSLMNMTGSTTSPAAPPTQASVE